MSKGQLFHFVFYGVLGSALLGIAVDRVFHVGEPEVEPWRVGGLVGVGLACLVVAAAIALWKKER